MQRVLTTLKISISIINYFCKAKVRDITKNFLVNPDHLGSHTLHVRDKEDW